MRRVLPVLLLAACAPDPEPVASWVEPMDGATGWPDDEPLFVYTPALHVPPDYEIRDLVRVVDLFEGGYVAGTFETWDDRVRFDPDRDWRPGRRYAWTLDVPSSLPHGPEWSIPEGLAGTAVFDTDPALEVLAAGFDEGHRVCVVLSGPAPSEVFDVRWTLNDAIDQEDVLTVLPHDDWAGDLIDQGLVPAVDVACLSLVFVAPGDRMRFWIGESGPWLVDLVEDPLVDLVAARYRFVPPGEVPADETDEEAPADEEVAP